MDRWRALELAIRGIWTETEELLRAGMRRIEDSIPFEAGMEVMTLDSVQDCLEGLTQSVREGSEAIKVLRKSTQDASDFEEGQKRFGSVDGLTAPERYLINKGQKVLACISIRDRTNSSLMEAKKGVEQYLGATAYREGENI